MTKQEANSIIERVWTEHLQRVDNVPEDLANKFSLWLQGVLKQAAPLLNKNSTSHQGQEQPQQQAGTEAQNPEQTQA